MTVYARTIGGARSNGLPAASYRYRGIPGWDPAATPAPPRQPRSSPEAAASAGLGPCGTRFGYEYHRRRNDPPCQACADARNAYRRQRRADGGNP